MTFPVLSANGPSGYNLTRSLRFRQSATAYLNRTPATTTNRRTWTWSAWVKRGLLDLNYHTIFGNGVAVDYIAFANDNSLIVTNFNSSSYVVTTTQVFRDPSAWYHIVVAMDTTQATASNRIKIYVNGVQVTAFSASTYPSQNYDTGYNTTTAQYLGYNTFNYFDGYLAEINFIDGQQLTPSSFGSTNAITGVWQPAKYTSTYGTNGFYLPFTDITSTTTLGYDSSGNGNNWTTNNISLTAGVTYDSMTDVPTLTSATAANFAVLNPLFIPTSAGTTNATLTSGNLQFVGNAVTDTSSRSTIGVTSGKWYCEVLVSVAPANQDGVGIAYTQSDSTRSIGVIYRVSGDKCVNNTVTAYGTGYAAGSLIGIALDADASTVTFYNTNVSQGAISFTPTTAIYFSTYGTNSVSSFAGNINFGQRPFTYTPPSGFVALNTYNLPASTIPNGASYMAATTYTGTGSNPRTFTGLAFQPDLIWNKSRSNAGFGALWDSVRGGTNALQTYSVSDEATIGTAGGSITSFNSDGATFANGSINDSWFNTSAVTYVSWQWKAGGTAVSNTSGTITSSVSANTTSGFSVVTYAGAGVNATVGHGLGVAPSMVIYKNRTGTQYWGVTHVSLTSYAWNLYLQNTDGQQNDGLLTAANSSTVLNLAVQSTVNASYGSYVAYCFAAIKGFSAFGSYTGNGSTDGPFVYLGFRPRYLMLKITTTAGYYWMIKDSSRDPYNTTYHELYANVSDAEYTASSYQLDFLSNGFKIKSAGQALNGSGDTYIYMAFAENPFQNSLAR